MFSQSSLSTVHFFQSFLSPRFILVRAYCYVFKLLIISSTLSNLLLILFNVFFESQEIQFSWIGVQFGPCLYLPCLFLKYTIFPLPFSGTTHLSARVPDLLWSWFTDTNTQVVCTAVWTHICFLNCPVLSTQREPLGQSLSWKPSLVWSSDQGNRKHLWMN